MYVYIALLSASSLLQQKPSTAKVVRQRHRRNFCCVVIVGVGLTRSPAIAEGPRDAGVPVEIW